MGKTRCHDSESSSESSSDDSKCSDRHTKRPIVKKFYKTVNNTTGTINNNTLIAFADFFGLMPGDNSATIAAGTGVSFPQDGPTNGIITRLSVNTFNLKNVGVYEVQFQVSVTEAGQLVVALDDGTGFLEVPNSVAGRATGTSQIVGISLLQTLVANTKLAVFNPVGNTPALTVTPYAGGAHPVSCHLVIKQIA